MSWSLRVAIEFRCELDSCKRGCSEADDSTSKQGSAVLAESSIHGDSA